MGGKRRSKTSYPQWDDLPVYHLVSATEDSIVFLDEGLAVDWKTSKSYDDDGRFPKGWPGVQNRYSALEDTLAEGASHGSRLRAHRLLAEGVARALAGNVAEAHEILDEAERLIVARNRELARLSYLYAAGISTAITSIVCVLIWLLRSRLQPVLGLTLFWMILDGGAGSLGAFLSVLLRKEAAPDPSAERQGHRAEACARVLIGACGALLTALAVQAGVLYPHLATSPSLLLLVCAFAGTSERLVPELTKRVEAAIAKPPLPVETAGKHLAPAAEPTEER